MSKVADALLLPETPLFTMIDDYECEHLWVFSEEIDGQEYFFCQDCGDEVDSLIDESKHNTKLYELNIHGMSSNLGTYENNLLERNKLIAKFEKAENTYQKNILMKEIKKIEGIIDQYTTLYYKAGREPIPEMKGYEPFKSIDEQPEKEAGEDSEKFTGEWDGTKIELVNDLRSDKDAGIYKTYAESYRHAEKHITVNGKPVKAKNLESLYYKTRSVS